MDFGFVLTALLAIVFGAFLSRFAREKLSNRNKPQGNQTIGKLDSTQSEAD